MNPLPTHRIAIEPRSSHGQEIWLLFYETLITYYLKWQGEGSYEQQLLRIFNCPECREIAEAIAIREKNRRKIIVDVIIRDNSQRHVRLRKA